MIKLCDNYKQFVRNKLEPHDIPDVFKSAYSNSYNRICKDRLSLTIELIAVCVMNTVWLIIAWINDSIATQAWGALFAIIACIVLIAKRKQLDKKQEIIESEGLMVEFIDETLKVLEEDSKVRVDNKEREEIINRCKEILHEVTCKD